MKESGQPGLSFPPLGLHDVDLGVYAWFLEHRTVDFAAVAAAAGVDEEEARRSIGRLLAAHLLAPGTGGPDTYFALSPETASAQLAAPVEARIRSEQQRLAEVRAELDRFLPAYFQRGGQSATLQVLENVQEVRDLLNRASRHCRSEVMSAQPGGGARNPEAMEEALERDRSMLNRGIRLRTLYHHTARFNGPSQAYVSAASALGAQYRTVYDLFGRLIVFDHELAFIQAQNNEFGAVVIREASTVAYLCEIFERTWDLAKPFADAVDDGLEEVSREIHQTIIQLLAAGLKDETIARRLGMSLRTARRHIANIMQEFDAGSRFQAGVIAAERGLLDVGVNDPDEDPADGAAAGD
ncbi:helix-turn-helix transcriptional regulator [Streptomyces sp. NBC_01764]|uniref:helix-turn-helix transcriptional regulator n=1 Tax=Streptomyces sp. NBC_01764 TaxID=2975935 RepID=UPI00225296F3|nr:helix-turn-helix transcriptional regulator [Streptomyces sp. NBC_01764]MCX4409536.1 helix-turn-helix transcriptional regulator [Streptomyces sp. NBC_01764]